MWIVDRLRISNSPGLIYAFDAAGNLQTRSDGVTFTHDARQRLIQVVNSGTTTNYVHDPLGRRIKKTVGSTTTWFLWDGSQLLAEYNGSGLRTKRYAYLEDDYAPTQVEDANGVYYVHTDHLDAPRLITSASAQIVWRARYEAFGRALVQEDPDGNSVPVSFNLGFPGQYFDAETGLHYNFMRDYDPALGRYLQTDPYGQEMDPNLFAYAANNPANEIDPTGEFLPILFAYGRCVAQCMALQALLGGLECFDGGDAAKDCALSCLNPLNLMGGGAGKMKNFGKRRQGYIPNKPGRKNQGRENNQKKKKKDWTYNHPPKEPPPHSPKRTDWRNK